MNHQQHLNRDGEAFLDAEGSFADPARIEPQEYHVDSRCGSCK